MLMLIHCSCSMELYLYSLYLCIDYYSLVRMYNNLYNVNCHYNMIQISMLYKDYYTFHLTLQPIRVQVNNLKISSFVEATAKRRS